MYSVLVPLKITHYEAIITKDPARPTHLEAQLSQVGEVFRCRIHFLKRFGDLGLSVAKTP